MFHILEFQETGCLGAALLAGMGRGVYASFEEAVEVARNRIHVHIVEPDTSRKDLYERSFQIFREAYATSRNIMHALAAGPDVPAAGQAIPHD